jgi:hypothetical protein
MAKRKAARGRGRGAAKNASTSRKSARKGAKKAARRTSARKSAARKGPARRPATRKATARKPTTRTGTGRKAAARKATARGTAKRTSAVGKRTTKAPRRATAKTQGARKTGAAKRPVRVATRAATTVPVRKAPALDRPRRTIADTDELVPSPPSSLDLDRSASAVRTGRREMHERYEEHTETSPALTGGDVDADWESAYSVGDEAPGGDNPTPDQDIVDDIGRAVGVEYEDNEELKGDEKIAKRDRKRWELDPASSEDYPDRD